MFGQYKGQINYFGGCLYGLKWVKDRALKLKVEKHEIKDKEDQKPLCDKN